MFRKFFSYCSEFLRSSLVSTKIENTNSHIHIDIDTNKKEFMVESLMQDLSPEAEETIGLLLFYISQGQLLQYIYGSLQIWAEEDPVKLQFISNLMKHVQALTAEHEQASLETKKKVAVRASNVFGITSMINK